MKPLIWKEFHENLKWAVLPALLILGPLAMFGAFPLMERALLFYVALVAAVFGAALGFLQVFFEAHGDKRSLLLHRPVSPSRIFLGKAVAGVGLYLLALGVPFACAVGLAATPGHLAEPFRWPMALPWLADVLTGLVYYFAGMLAAQREARWYGSRCLGLAAGLCCSYLVWVLPEFWHALLAIGVLGGVVAVAAWGSFTAGGAYAPQPRLARAALALTFLAGLSALVFTGKAFLGMGFQRADYSGYDLGRQGRVLIHSIKSGRLVSVTDLEGQVPPELRGQRLDDYALKQITAPSARNRGGPRTRSYRSPGRFLVEFGNESKPGDEAWWYVPPEGRLLGYDRTTKHFLGSFGPDGYCPPEEHPGGRFQGELLSCFTVFYLAWNGDDYLVFPGGVYDVDFRKRTVQPLFVPAAGETVRWAGRWEDEKLKASLAFVTTDRAVYALEEDGSQVFSAPLAFDPDSYRCSAGRLEGPRRYWVWYFPQWYRGFEVTQTTPPVLVEYDAAGGEMARRTLPPLPQTTAAFFPPVPEVEPSYGQAVFGPVTPPAEAAVLVGTTQALFSDLRAHRGREMWLLLQFLVFTGNFFIPGGGWYMPPDRGLLVAFTALMVLSAAACALVCVLLARRYSFSRARGLGWALCGLLFGPTGLLLMLALQEWPARVSCPSCRRPRRVDRDRCEHCGAAHALPAPDGTEIFETAAATAEDALVCHPPASFTP
jgi:hypothetical protein